MWIQRQTREGKCHEVMAERGHVAVRQGASQWPETARSQVRSRDHPQGRRQLCWHLTLGLRVPRPEAMGPCFSPSLWCVVMATLDCCALSWQPQVMVHCHGNPSLWCVLMAAPACGVLLSQPQLWCIVMTASANEHTMKEIQSLINEPNIF